ncbi:MAG: hypothetical protein ACI8ZM_003866 [Crocinitomix sp.]|jgi:hypothetical protein
MIMIRQTFLLLVAIFFGCYASAQDFCMTPTTISAQNKASLIDGAIPDYSNYSFCVKVYVHVVRRSDGSGGQSDSDVAEAMGILDMDFNPYYIYFDWNNVTYIDDTEAFNNPAGNWLSFADHEDGIDIYLFDDLVVHPITGLGYGQTTGVGDDSKLMLTGHWYGPDSTIFPLVTSRIISHEMGHVMFLWHTHHGTVTEGGDPDQCPELVNGSNSHICGDYITDSPADPGMGFNVDLETCEWLGSGTDSNGDPYDPDEHNAMSYSQPYCMEYLTFKQSIRMKTALAAIPHLQLVSTFTSFPNKPCKKGFTLGLDYYPNPVDNELNLDLRNKPDNSHFTYYLYDSNKKEVLSGESSNKLVTLNTSTLKEGIYFLHFYENEELTIEQIVVKH